MIKIEQIPVDIAENLCRKITVSLPEYFGLPEVNEHYAIGIRERINIAAKIDDQYVGLISLEFPYPSNCNIYWMAVLPEYMSLGIGTKLIDEACSIAQDQLVKTITVETLSPKNADENYLKTYNFYLANGFTPLFDLKPQVYEWNMVYMARNIEGYYSHQKNKNLSIKLLERSDIAVMVEDFSKANWPKPVTIFEHYLQEQKNGKRLIWVAYLKGELAGYITLKMESKYQSFLDKNIPEINDFNVLPAFRNQGIGLQLLKTAEDAVKSKSDIVGLGVGLYEGYGAAQKLYIKQGYIPDGLGITYNCAKVKYGSNVTLDDDLVLCFSKKLK